MSDYGPRALGLLLLCAATQVRADHPMHVLDTGVAGPVATIPAHTLARGGAVLSASMQYIDHDEIPDAVLADLASHHEHVHSTASVLQFALNGAFGLRDDFTVGFSLPYVDRQDLREGEHDGGEVARLGDAKGLGDVSLFGQYRFWRDAGSGSAAAVLLGVKAPTGTTDRRAENGERFGAEHQPGSGSWDGLFGLSFSTRMGRMGIDANGLYALASQGAQATDAGDALHYNLSLAWRVLAGEMHRHDDGTLHHHDHPFLRNWDVSLELNGEWRDRIEVGGEGEPHTGGHVLYFSPGTHVMLHGGWLAYASVSVPILTDLNGVQAEPEYRVIAGIGKHF